MKNGVLDRPVTDLCSNNKITVIYSASTDTYNAIVNTNGSTKKLSTILDKYSTNAEILASIKDIYTNGRFQ